MGESAIVAADPQPPPAIAAVPTVATASKLTAIRRYRRSSSPLPLPSGCGGRRRWWYVPTDALSLFLLILYCCGECVGIPSENPVNIIFIIVIVLGIPSGHLTIIIMLIVVILFGTPSGNPVLQRLAAIGFE